MALRSIHQFGPQGELMLIEGIAKDKNSVIRAECARGLGINFLFTFILKLIRNVWTENLQSSAFWTKRYRRKCQKVFFSP